MNFKKNGIFGRREDGGQREAEYDGYSAPSQVLAVWGSPGSGKTTVAVKLAKYLAGKKKNVILLLCDMTAPMLPCICPPGELECEHIKMISTRRSMHILLGQRKRKRSFRKWI